MNITAYTAPEPYMQALATRTVFALGALDEPDQDERERLISLLDPVSKTLTSPRGQAAFPPLSDLQPREEINPKDLDRLRNLYSTLLEAFSTLRKGDDLSPGQKAGARRAGREIVNILRSSR